MYYFASFSLWMFRIHNTCFSLIFGALKRLDARITAHQVCKLRLSASCVKTLLSLHPEAIRGSSQQQLQLPLKMYTVEGY